MLAELRVRELGVIADLTVVLGPGMIALTGETGTGKTLVVEAIELLLGGRADPVLVRPGAAEAIVEGRFSGADDGDEVVLARTIPAVGRSRAYVDGRMSPLTALAQAAGPLIDLHGQHSHQSLLSGWAQRAGLDAFAQIDLEPIAAARRRIRESGEALAGLGGDTGSRAREHDMLDFQVTEIDAAKLADTDEDEQLAQEEERLAGAVAHRAAADEAIGALTGDGAAADTLGRAVGAVAGHEPLAQVHERIRAVAIELADAASDLRSLAETLEEDPQRLAWVRERRQLLRQLRRKYGDTLAAVIEYGETARTRLAELDSYEHRAALLEQERDQAMNDFARAEEAIGQQRRHEAPGLAAAIEQRLRGLSMPKARFDVRVGDKGAGDDVVWLLGANPGEPLLPLSKVASGGELARTMLAARLVLGPASKTPVAAAGTAVTTLVFDEVDAGIGGEAALAVGRALADLAKDHQVLVVTHLPQVAAFADQQIAVYKAEVEGRTVATAQRLDEPGRVVELSRMLSGQPDSAAARVHAEELLSFARRSGSAE
jgi:DNA repair protein RecN (Recombination protein N)